MKMLKDFILFLSCLKEFCVGFVEGFTEAIRNYRNIEKLKDDLTREYFQKDIVIRDGIPMQNQYICDEKKA